MTPKGGITSLDVRPDGSVLAFGRESGCIQVFDLVKGERLVERLENSGSGNRAVRFSPNGAYLATAGFAGVISVWDAQYFEPHIRIETGDNNARAVSFRSDSAIIGATGTGDGIFRMFEVATGKEVWRSDPTNGGCHSVAFVGMNGVLGQHNGMLSGWRREQDPSKQADAVYKYDGALEAFVDKIYCLASHGNLLLAGGDRGTGVNLYDATGQWPRLMRFAVPRPMAVNAVAFSEDGRTVAAACSDGVVRLAELEDAIAALADPTEVKFLDAIRAAPDEDALRLVYADWLEERAGVGDVDRAAYLRVVAKALPALPDGHPPTHPQWKRWVDRETCAAPRTIGQREPFPTELGTTIHKDWTRDAIVSSVAFVRSSTIVSGHFDGTIRFWPYRPKPSPFASAVLKPEGDAWAITDRGDAVLWRAVL